MEKSSENTRRIAERRTKAKKKKSFKGRAVKCLAAAVLIYLALSIIFGMHSGVTTVIALNGTVKESVVADGYVFRSQSVINSPASGYMECRVSDGERVSKGEVVGYIYTGEYDAERASEMQSINERIEYLENSSAAASTYAGNSVLVEQKIASAARKLSDASKERSFKDMPERLNELNLLIERKSVMESGNTVEREEAVTQLKNRLSELESASSGARIAVTAETGGVFTAKIDGLESELTVENAFNITPSYLKELDSRQILRNDSVTEGQPMCKTVDNYEWYFGTVMDYEDAKDLKVGQRVEMNFYDSSSSSVYGNIERISEEEKGKVAVTVYANRYIEGIYASSRASAEITTTGAEGIKLPVKSLHVNDGRTGVYVLRLGVARFVPVNIRYKNEEWAIVSSAAESGDEYRLQIYDEVIVNAKNLDDGKVVR